MSADSVTPMLLACVKFALPFRLRLPAGSYFVLQYRGVRYGVRTRSGDAERVLTYGDPELRDAYEFKVTQKRGAREVDVGWMMLTGDPDHFIAEFKNLLSFTLFDVVLETPGPLPVDKAHQRALSNMLREQALEALQHFVNVYRDQTKEWDVYRPAREDSPGGEVWVAEDYTFDEDRFEGRLQRLHGVFNFESVRGSGRLKTPMNDEEAKELARRLRQDRGVPVYTEMQMDALTQCEVRGNFRLSVVTSMSAFELFLRTQLPQWCEFHRVKRLPVSRKPLAKTKPAAEAIAGASLARLLDVHCRTLCGRSVKDNGIYQKWYDAAYNLRNEILHRGRSVVSREEAQSAIAAVDAYIQYLWESLLKGGSK